MASRSTKTRNTRTTRSAVAAAATHWSADDSGWRADQPGWAADQPGWGADQPGWNANNRISAARALVNNGGNRRSRRRSAPTAPRPKLGKPKLVRGSARLSSTRTEDCGTLSVIFEKAELVNDKRDARGKVESQTYVLEIPITAVKQPAMLRMELRGALAVSSPASWSLILIIGCSRRLTLTSSGQAGNVFASLGLPVQKDGKVAVTVSLMALRDASDVDSFAFAALDSLDFTWVD